nr:CTP synthase [Parachlamydiaceae bacterium]
QVIPHITDEIKQRILNCSKQIEGIDVVLVEIGGTVGDIESLPFMEAIRQFRYDHPGDCMNIHLTYVPYLKAAGEVKTKPSQHSAQVLREIGIFPDMILCRCEMSLAEDVKDKISLFCNVPRNAVFEEVDVEHSIYEVPLKLHEQNVDDMICRHLKLPNKQIHLKDWEKLLETIKNPKGTVTIGIIGKYVDHQDAYKSILESLDHAAMAEGFIVKIKRYEADKIIQDNSVEATIKGCDGYLVPGGFGERGWMGKILTAKYCRENKIPYFGICLGMQVLAVEFARHAVGLTEANSTEIDAYTKDPVISLLSEQRHVQDVGGTMRLGAFNCNLLKGSKAHAAYGKDIISERHRHRFEFNNKYREQMEEHGLQFTGNLEGGVLCEIAEVKDHPWMVGVQYHPEFKSKPTDPHPLFRSFIKACIRT